MAVNVRTLGVYPVNVVSSIPQRKAWIRKTRNFRVPLPYKLNEGYWNQRRAHFDWHEMQETGVCVENTNPHESFFYLPVAAAWLCALRGLDSVTYRVPPCCP